MSEAVLSWKLANEGSALLKSCIVGRTCYRARQCKATEYQKVQYQGYWNPKPHMCEWVKKL